MPKLDKEVIMFRDTTVRVVKRMVEIGKTISEKEALKILYERSKKKLVVTGFSNEVVFERYYQNYRNFKSKYGG